MRKPKYVSSTPDRHGKVRHRFRHKGVSRYLPGEPGSPEFQAAYNDALKAAQKANTPAPRKPAPRRPKGSVEALVRDYRGTTRFQRLAAPTKRQYESAFVAFIDKFGDADVGAIKTRHVLGMMDGLKATPGVANAYLRTLKLLLNYAVLRGELSHNPASSVQPIKLDEIATWTEDDIARFEKRWPLGTIERRIFNVALSTGQRSSDLRKMRVDDIKDGWITVRQSKTGELVELPLHPALQADLEAFPPKGDHLISRPDGRPYSDGVLSKKVKAALRAAGIPDDRKLHGLRKATCRRLAEAGCSERQIMSVSGHRSPQMVSTYVRQADQRLLAMQAMGKLTPAKAALSNPVLSNP